LAVVSLAVELTAWLQMLAFTDHPARRWEPKRLRLRLFSIAGSLVRHARLHRLRLSAHTPRRTKSAIGALVERATGYLALLHLTDAHGAAEVQEAMVKSENESPRARSQVNRGNHTRRTHCRGLVVCSPRPG